MNEEEIKSALNCNIDEFNKKYDAYKKAKKEFEEIYEPFKGQLLNLYEKQNELPSSIIIGNAKLIYVSPSIRTTIDSKKLKEEEPEIAKKFTKTTEVKATLRLEGV